MLFVDPGANIGMALFGTLGKQFCLVRVRAFSDWMDSEVKKMNILVELNTDKVVCERPTYMGPTAAQSNALTKLSMSAGAVWGMCLAKGVQFEWLDVKTWKGQLPKRVVHERVLKLLSPRENMIVSGVSNEHVLDAVGMGLYYTGRMK